MLSVGGSLLVHAGLAGYFFLQASTRPVLADRADVGGANPVAISLIRLPADPVQPSAVAATQPTETDASRTPHALAAQDTSTELPTTDAPHAAASTDRAGAPASGAVVASTASPASASPAAIGSDYRRRLLEHIQPFRRYPEAASRIGAHGVVLLMFQIDRGGRVLGVWVAQSSGSDLLDTAAIETVRRAAPLPPIPAELPEAIIVRLPVQFNGNG